MEPTARPNENFVLWSMGGPHLGGQLVSSHPGLTSKFAFENFAFID